MHSKTKIIVLHMKEIIYTAVFLLLALLLIVLLLLMFRPEKKNVSSSSHQYTPGVYTSTLTLNNTNLEVEVAVDESHINSIRFANLDETVTTAYPLIQPAIEDLAAQICNTQSLEDITYSSDTPYTSKAIADTIAKALEKAAVD